MNHPSEMAPDKLLFTPGPLTTSAAVKQAMLHDAGSWHFEFNALIQWIRSEILSIAGLAAGDGWETVLLQGSGTFGVESVFATCVVPGGKVCVLANGAYGERMVQMLEHLKISYAVLRAPENEWPDLEELDRMLSDDPEISHLAAIHCETTTGILNPIEDIGQIARRHGCLFIVDAMSSFGAVPIDFGQAGIDFLISSPNKCLESVPGFSFVIARRAMLLANEKNARSLSLNLAAQLRGFEKNGQFRYTPPTHTLLAFERALTEFHLEGGVTARGVRYQHNHEILMEGMQQLGFKPYLSPAVQSHLITAFYFPADTRFQFIEFYRRLSEKGFIIYPGKISQAETFRIGNIGHIFEADIRALVKAVGDVMKEMNFSAAQPSETTPTPLNCFPILA